MAQKTNFEKQLNNDGTKNPKYVDLLEEDKPIAGQKFVCVSFVSPENILKQKEVFYFEQFLKHWDFSKSTQKFTQFLNFMSFKYNLNFDKVMSDFQEYTKSEADDLAKTTIDDDYKNFLDAKEEELEQEFLERYNFQTSTRGIKVRGAYPTQQEAELRCRMLREVDPNHDVYVGPVGLWMPWNPQAYKTGRVEYLEDELNQLMHEKNQNEKEAKVAFEKRVKEAKRAAIEENVKIAKESGNKLTQNIDSDGNLVGVANMNTTESGLNNNVSSADIRKELFEGANIRTRETDKRDKENQKQKDSIAMEVTEKKD
jgi:hypothetical protein|tara:strand:+ start:123 stop:1061 length:939 start_codon:yes stop_codon:yes gene_type:complete